MSKSRGNVVSPALDRRALRRRHRPLLHPLHRPARPGRRLVRRRRRGHAPLPRAALAPGRGDSPSGDRCRRRCPTSPTAPTSSCCARRTGRSTRSPRDLRPLRLQHRDRGGDGAGQRVLRACARRPARAPLRFALVHRRVAALPVRAARGRRRLRAAERRSGCGSSPGRRPTPRCSSARVYELVCQVNGKLRDRVQAPTDATAEELKELCRAAPNVQAHLDGKEVVKEIVVPGKLVNLVVGRRAGEVDSSSLTYR